jgi:hypothetical protein
MPMSVTIASRKTIDVASGIIATSAADARIAANSGFCIPNICVSLPEKYELARFASDAMVRIMPTSKTDSSRLPYAKSGMPVV